MQISENLFTGEISKAVTETKTNERNSLVNQVEIKYEMFCKIRNFRSFFVLVKKVVTKPLHRLTYLVFLALWLGYLMI